MRVLHTISVSTVCIVAAGWGTAYATQPPDPVSSDGAFNTAMGTNALLHLTTISGGGAALEGLSADSIQGASADDGFVGVGNTASGRDALLSNTSGSFNTSAGYQALSSNTTGTYNTAIGVASLYNNNGNFNTASGAGALNANTSGNNNSALGQNALLANTAGSGNTASGFQAISSNTTGNYNTGSGYEALLDNKSGAQNSAYGLYALHGNTRGDYNTGLGGYALYSNSAGSSNIALGYKAGFYPTAGTNNIHIGNLGAPSDTAVTKIGTQGTQSALYIAGASNAVTVGASQSVAQIVVNTTTGQIGVQGSSERFKTAIEPMGASTEKLEQLRPVSFAYKSAPDGARQYGLIAEEVAKVYPELVVRDAKGEVLSVRYDELAPMLLNVVQRQQQRLAEQDAKMAKLETEIQALQVAKQN